MKWIATLALSLCILSNASAYDDGKTRIGSLPLKNGTMMLVQEYLSKARLPEKVVVVSNYSDVYAFSTGLVTKILSIDDNISVFIKKGSHYFVYNNLRAVAVDEGERLEKGELIGEVYHDRKYDGYQMEMQIWYDYGSRTCRLPNKQVMGILQGDEPCAPKLEKPKVAKRTPVKHSKSSKKTYSHKSSNKKIAYRKTTSHSKKKVASHKKAVAHKKAVVHKKKKH